MRRALPLALLLVGAAALPSAAHAGNLSVSSVSAARSATAGLTVAVEVGVARRDRAPAAKLRFYLSANAKRDRRDVRLKGDAAVGRSRGRRRPGGRTAGRPGQPGGRRVPAHRRVELASARTAAPRGAGCA